MGRWRGYTPEERDARRQADKQLRETADALLSDPARVETMHAAMRGVSARIANYSLRNQALLYSQAEARGIALTDVDSVKGWRLQGRKVRRGERGLRIVAPRGRQDPTSTGQDGKPQETPAPDGQSETTDQDGGGEVYFRMVSVFDLSQTEDATSAADQREAVGSDG